MKNLRLTACLLGIAAGNLAVHADTVPFNFTRQAGNQWGYTVGMDFTVNSAVTVSALGTFDSNLNGLTDPVTTEQINNSLAQGLSSGIYPVIQVGIFDTATGLEVTPTASFFYNDPNVASYYAIAGSIFQNISPISLPAGTYSIVAAGYNYALSFGNIALGSTTPTFDNMSGALTLAGQTRVNGTGFGVPPLVLPTDYTSVETQPNFSAGTFIAHTAATPDAGSTAAMLGGAFALLASFRRK